MTRTRPAEQTKQRTRPPRQIGSKPVKWNKDRCRQAYTLAMLFGATDKQVAEAMDVSIQTIDYWKRNKPEFREALTSGKAIKDDQVERSLFEKATGCSIPETDVKVIDGRIVKTEITKHYPPDTTACIFWLKNRRRNSWSDVYKMESRHTHVLKQIDLTDFTEEELELMESAGVKRLMQYNDKY